MIDGIVVIERYQKGYLTAYSVDEGETFHPSVDEALIHLQTKEETHIEQKYQSTKTVGVDKVSSEKYKPILDNTEVESA